MPEIIYKPIGTVHSPFKEPGGTPIQPAASDAEGAVEVFPEYAPGLKDLDGFSHIILLYHFHRSGKPNLVVKPFMDTESRGIFAIRAPSRPNSIGMSVVRLLRVDGCILHVRGLDILDGAPLLDIKPYVPKFDSVDAERIGWLGENVRKLETARDDGRFC
ncbi:MAG: tRNA (N6-threonylcarbamoyladenosine(37)-N6)-methyltransferase TrmO [Thermoplasmata archaeon]